MNVLDVYTRLAPRTDPASRSEMARRAEAVAFIESAPGDRMGAMRQAAEKWGFSFGTMKRHYYAWKQRGEAAFLDLRHEGRGMAASSAFAECLKKYAEGDLNTTFGGWQRMMAEFRGGAVLPCGIGKWSDVWQREHPFEAVPDRCPEDYVPSGASYGNLVRALRNDPDTVFALAASRRGMRAAHAHVLPVLTTRRGLAVGAVYQFDDVWHNIDIMLPTGKVAQPLEFAGYDVASAFKCASIVKPRFTSEDGSRRNLTEQQFRFLLGFTLCVTGFHKGGVRLVVEHGTTAIRGEVERQIKLIPGFGQLVSFARSGILSEQVHAGLFIGSGGGNFRFKAMIESSHGVMHNATASLPGNRGRDAEHMHESRDALVRYEEKTAAELDKWGGPGFSARMVSGLLSFDEYVSAFRRAEAAVMDSPKHKLEGWDGREVAEYRLGDDAPWTDAETLMDMAPAQAAAIAAFLAAHPQHRRRRYMTRREVWARGQADLVRVPLFEMAAFLAPADARECVVREDGTFAFRDALYYGRDEVVYRAEARDFHGAVRRFAPGTKLAVKWNPLVPDRVWILDRDSGATLGTAPLHARAPVYDKVAVERALGAQSHDLARKVLPVRGRHQREAEDRAARIALNAQLLREARGMAPSPVPARSPSATSHADAIATLEAIAPDVEPAADPAFVPGTSSALDDIFGTL